MINKELRIITISDLHLGHRKTPAKHIVKNLDIFFNNYKKRNDIDIIFIAGDIFDTNLYLSDNDVTSIYNWFASMIRFCSDSGIKLRVLLGTYSHDHNQAKLLELMVENSEKVIDFRYITQLDVEIIEEYNLSVLYIPDEWRSNNYITLEEAKKAINDKGLVNVDLAIMHGAFDYQLPTSDKSSVHESKAYIELVNYYVFVGHVHNFSVNDSIIAQGSFDRLVHGDEVKKGGVLSVIRPDTTKEIVFLENKNAMPYISFTPKDDWLDKLKKLLLSLEVGYVRLVCSSTHECLGMFSELAKINPSVKLSKKIIDKEEVKKDIYLKDDLVESIQITPTNIIDLVSSLVCLERRDDVIKKLKVIV